MGDAAKLVNLCIQAIDTYSPLKIIPSTHLVTTNQSQPVLTIMVYITDPMCF
jgi:hypothetical protein